MNVTGEFKVSPYGDVSIYAAGAFHRLGNLVNVAKELQSLKDKNRRLEKDVESLKLDKRILQDIAYPQSNTVAICNRLTKQNEELRLTNQNKELRNVQQQDRVKRLEESCAYWKHDCKKADYENVKLRKDVESLKLDRRILQDNLFDTEAICNRLTKQNEELRTCVSEYRDEVRRLGREKREAQDSRNQLREQLQKLAMSNMKWELSLSGV